MSLARGWFVSSSLGRLRTCGKSPKAATGDCCYYIEANSLLAASICNLTLTIGRKYQENNFLTLGETRYLRDRHRYLKTNKVLIYLEVVSTLFEAMAHTEWIKVVRTGLGSRRKRQSSSEDSRRPMKPRSPPPASQGKNKFSALAVKASSSDVKTRSSSSADRRVTGAGFTSVMPKDKFQPAFSKALRARVAFLKRRLSSAEMKNLARSVRRGWTPTKKSLLRRGRKPGLGYIPNQKPKYSAVLKNAKVPAPPAAVKGIEFIKGKTLAGSRPVSVAKDSSESKSLPAVFQPEAKAKVKAAVSAGARLVASIQERSAQAQLASARLQLHAQLGREESPVVKSALLSKFRAQYPGFLDRFIRVKEHVSISVPVSRRGSPVDPVVAVASVPKVFVDMDALLPSSRVSFVNSAIDFDHLPPVLCTVGGESRDVSDPEVLASVCSPEFVAQALASRKIFGFTAGVTSRSLSAENIFKS